MQILNVASPSNLNQRINVYKKELQKKILLLNNTYKPQGVYFE